MTNYIRLSVMLYVYQGQLLELIWLYRPWTVIEKCMISDGSSYELTITYKDNRKRKFHGDVGGGTVDNTVIDFLKTIPELAERI